MYRELDPRVALCFFSLVSLDTIDKFFFYLCFFALAFSDGLLDQPAFNIA